ncbi:hypothetical protein MKW98_002960 [Papaver atlanticum]|uniref:Pectinesterase inhibitor domain-containing protein n=1 Tax=Papaver atlanticum TaxID=357466 RepID=A0AAD4TKG6_9MAGN|nr:hypothetical protein MKW98_002960 [Papaver atlanticum]
MVVSSYTNSLMGLLILLFAITASTATRDVITSDSNDEAHFDAHQICPRVKDKDFCDMVMESYVGIFGFDVKEVGTIFLDVSTNAAGFANSKILELIPKAPDAQKARLEHCNQLYTSFPQKDKGILTQLLEQKDYVGLNREAGILAKHTTDCEDSFKPAPSPLTRENSNFFNIIDMISVFSCLLIH